MKYIENEKKISSKFYFHSSLHIWDHCDYFPFTREQALWGNLMQPQYLYKRVFAKALRTDGWTNGPTNGRMDRWTNPLIEMQGCI